MRLPEHEALTKWCPLVRMPVLNFAAPIAGNVDTTGTHVGHCIGSRCMMWVWHQKQAKIGVCGLTNEPAFSIAGDKPE